MNPAVFTAPPANACTPGSEGADGPDRITKNNYDAAGQLLKVQKAYGTSLQQDYVTYTYSPNGKQTSVTDANGNKASLVYDGHDRQSHWYFPDKAVKGQVSTTDYEQYGYDANGNRTSLRKRDGQVIAYAYDALNRVTVKDVPGTGGDVAYAYDLRGLQTSATFTATGRGTSSVYDGFGRLASSTSTMSGASRTLSYQHDANGNRTRLTWPDNQVTSFTYDGLDRMVGVHEGDSGPVLASYTYNPDGRRSGMARRSGASSGYGYDGAGRLSSLSHDLAGASGDVTSGFGYNPASQIITRSRSNDAYAFIDNYNVTRSYAANGLNQYLSAGPAAFAYDANGNMTSDGSVTFAYDVENRLVSASGAKTAALSYDPQGRLFQTSGGSAGITQFLYDGDALVAEYDGSGTLLRRYVHGSGVDEPLVWYEGAGLSQPRYLHADHQGSVVAVGDAQAGMIAVDTYDPYGIPGATNQGRFQYTGQIMIPEIGFYHYKARIYSPTIGRFLQTDPIGYDDQINLYAYVGNDPVNARDSSGKAVEFLTHNLVGGLSHAKIIVIPENQQAYARDPHFQNKFQDGRRFATLGAGPENGKLVGRPNRPTDVDDSKNNFRRVLDLPKGQTEDQVIAKLFAADAGYNDSLDYDVLPGISDWYNSNSYASGVLGRAGFNVPKVGLVPGLDKPIPSGSIDKKVEAQKLQCTGSRIERTSC